MQFYCFMFIALFKTLLDILLSMTVIKVLLLFFINQSVLLSI